MMIVRPALVAGLSVFELRTDQCGGTGWSRPYQLGRINL